MLVTGRARVLQETPDGKETPLNRLVPGDEFGEGALFAGGKRVATVRASTTVEALRIERDRFLALTQELPALREALELLARWRTLQGFLHTASNFGRLPAPVLNAVIAGLKPATAAKGDLILREEIRPARCTSSGRAVRGPIPERMGVC